MTSRVLPRAEWHKVADLPIGPALSSLNERDTQIMVVEDETGAVLGAWAAIRYVHLHGLWIAPGHRGRGRVGARLIALMRRAVRAFGQDVAITGAETPEVASLITGYGGLPLPGQSYVLHVEGHGCLPLSRF